ncbi:hypothetical protein LTR04_001670 [Oleoguttula sp. CCFEE 6159]|nr:hypothetical protein LTR04_001670 [Oleoguttula sp. CCFEE 6159]
MPPDDCKPNKALRLTVKAFLKSEEKKRDKERREAAPTENVTPAPPTLATVTRSDETTAIVPENGTPAAASDGTNVVASVNADENVKQTEIQTDLAPITEPQDVPQLSIEGPNQQKERQTSTSNVGEVAGGGAAEAQAENIQADEKTLQNEEQGIQEGGNQVQSGAWSNNGGQGQDQMFANGFGFDGSQQGFAGMDWSAAGGYNPMMQMQNGVPNAQWAGFPNMMGMPGMGMDPMSMSQGIFGGFGGNGMSMNTLNGMSMGNMNMGFNGGYGGAWNGQQGMSGDFGANAGYYPVAGYNQHQSHQGPYGNQMHHQQYPSNNFQNQNRFHGQQGHTQREYAPGHGGFGGQGGQSQVPQASGHIQQQVKPAPSKTPQPDDDDAFSHQLPIGFQGRRPSQQLSTEPPQQPKASESVAPRAGADSNVEAEQKDVVLAEVDDIPDAEARGESKVEEANIDTKGTQDTDDDIVIPADTTGEQVENKANPAAKNTENSLASGLSQPQAIETFDSTAYDGKGTDMGSMNMMSQSNPLYSQNILTPNGPIPAPSFGQYLQQPLPRATPEFPSRGRGGFGRGGYQDSRGGFRGRAGYSHVNVVNPGSGLSGTPSAIAGDITVLTGPPAGPPVDAPKGPKAMREGLPNTGFRGRGGFSAVGRGGMPPPPAVLPKAKSKSPERAKSKSRSGHERSRSRSRSRHQRRKHRNRSPSTSTEDSETRERRRERRKRRERKYEEDSAAVDEDGSESEETRDASPDDASSSKHRSRRDKDRRRSSRSKRDRSREHRRHRHRSRSPTDDEDRVDGKTSRDEPSPESGRHKSRSHRERERDRTRDKDKDRKRSRRDRSSSIVDRESKDSEKVRSSRRSRHSRNDHNSREADGKDDVGFKIKGSKAATLAPTSTTTPFRPPTGPKKDRERDRRGSQHSQASALPVSASPITADPHTLEREARNRERMLKEEQRRASLSLGKRPHSSVDESTPTAPGSVNPSKNVFDPPTGPKADKSSAKSSRRRGEPNGSSKSRRTSYKYEEEEKDEVRAARVEREREAGRWA